MSAVSWQQALERLTDRDLLVIDDLDRFRLLTTRQIQRLRFPVRPGAHATPRGATKAAFRVLDRLRDYELVDTLERRIGGARSGSQGLIWQLSPTGSRLQRERTGRGSTHRHREPQSIFVQHTLGVAELAVIVHELQRDEIVELVALDTEPGNWRTFLGPHLRPVSVKPDLTLVTASGDYEQHRFIEWDRATEHLPKVVAKCRTYAAYAATGTEEQERGVFPEVLWVTSDTGRAEAIASAIHRDPALPDQLFRVVPLERFAATIATHESADDGLP